MKHFIKGVEVTPRNLEDIGITVNFSKDVQQESLNVDSVVVPMNGRKIIMEHLKNLGISEGIPYEVQFADKKLPYYIDVLESLKVRSNEVEVRIKQRYAHDNFIENADSLTFDFLNTQDRLLVYDVAYKIIQTEPMFKSIVMTVTIYALARTLQDQVRELAKSNKEFVAILAYSPFPFGKAVEAGIQLTIQIAYIAVMLYQIKKLATDLVELMFPKKRYFKACKVKELLTTGCKYIGYTFKSSIFDGEYKDLAIVSIPQNKEKKKFSDYLESELNFAFNTGYPTIIDSTPTLGSLIKAMQTMFNARIKVRNKVVEFERWDYWIDQAQGSVNVALPIQDDALDEFEIDTDKNFKRYMIQYQTDYSDMTTLDDYANTVSEYSAERQNVSNQDLNLLKGLTWAQIPFARAKRKTFENDIEREYRKTLERFDEWFGTNSSKNVSPVGIMEVSTQFFSVTKLILITDYGKLLTNEKMFPSYLWDKFHYINNPNLYSWITRKKVPTAMTEKQFLQLLDNNYAQINGKQSEILNMEFLPMQNKALIDFKQKSDLYKQNVIIQKIY